MFFRILGLRVFNSVGGRTINREAGQRDVALSVSWLRPPAHRKIETG
jgi:hypothetical protein